MKKPTAANLSFKEIEDLVAKVEKIMPSDPCKDMVIEILDFFKQLLEDLKTSKVSINKLKALLGFHSERLKKQEQTH